MPDATPVPTSQRPSVRIRGRRSRPAHPNRSAPVRRHSTRWRLDHGTFRSGSSAGSLRMRSSTGSMPSATASSSIADSSANIPGVSPGARMIVGGGTSSRASRCVVRRCSAA